MRAACAAARRPHPGVTRDTGTGSPARADGGPGPDANVRRTGTRTGILPRLSEFLGQQGGAAIAVTFQLPVAGLFLGIRMANWHEALADRAREARHPVRQRLADVRLGFSRGPRATQPCQHGCAQRRTEHERLAMPANAGRRSSRRGAREDPVARDRPRGPAKVAGRQCLDAVASVHRHDQAWMGDGLHAGASQLGSEPLAG